jgi:PAS domain S-box-containing protein
MAKRISRNADVPANLLTQAAMAAPWGFAITDHQRKGSPVVFVNQAFEFVSGQKADEALGKSWRCLLGSDPESHSLARLQQAVRQGSHCSVLLQSARKDGSLVRSELSVAPVINRSGDVTHLSWLCRDITFQIEQEERLAATVAEKEERFSSYVENATEAIWRLDFKSPIRLDIPESQQVREIFDNGIFRECNDAGARIYGLDKGEAVIGQPLRVFMEPSNPENVERVAGYVSNRFCMRNLISYEKDADGTTRTIVNNIVPSIQDSKVRHLWGASLDVTDHFETLQALAQSQEELAEKTKALEAKNTALRELIAHIEQDKEALKDRIAANVEQVLLPSLEKIRRANNRHAYIEQHRRTLEDLTSSFGRRVAENRLKLTPREIEVCNFVKVGLTSKEIASLLKIAVHTVEKHRRTARNKLDLANKGINLRTYLNSL